MSQQKESEVEVTDCQPAVQSPVPQLRLLSQGPDNAKKKKAFQDLRNILFEALTRKYVPVARRTIQLMKRCQPFPVGQSCLDFSYSESPDEQLKYCSPLMIACQGKEKGVEMAKLLVDEGASADYSAPSKGLTSLHVACMEGNKELVELLISCELKSLQVAQEKTQRLKMFLNARIKRNAWVPLMYAVKNGHWTIVKALLDSGHVETFKINKKGQSSLHIAARGGHLECLKILHTKALDTVHQESPYQRLDKNGWNIIHHVCAGGHLHVLKWLLTNVPFLNQRDVLNLVAKSNKYTPLMVACEYQKLETVQYLLCELPEGTMYLGLPPQDETSTSSQQRGKTGLHLAALHDCTDIAEILIEKGCPLFIQDEKGDTALHIAQRKSSFDVADMLKKADTSEELQQILNDEDQTPTEVSPEEVIPPEIIKRKKVHEYRQALRKGKTKIPRCNLLVLGEKRVGKTSTIRNLTGKSFRMDLSPTRGIDNEFVDVVEHRLMSAKCWKMTTRTDQNKKLVLHAAAQVVNTEDDQKQQNNKQQTYISEPDLIAELNRIERELKGQRKRPSHTQHKRFSQPKRKKFSHATVEDDSMFTATSDEVHPSEAPPIQVSPVQAARKRKQPSSHSVSSDTTAGTSTPAAKKLRPTNKLQLSRQSQLATIKDIIQRKEEPELHFNVLDFAGQPLYRPMHHCFIVRRAMYLVVFNLKEVFKALQSGDRSSIEEIAYWLNSIHIHIHKASLKLQKESKPVFLVGTHMNGLSSANLKCVHNELKKLFYERNDHIVNDLHLVDATPYEVFAPIENSEVNRDESGIIVLQKELKSTSKFLPFIKEVFPTHWLQLEDALMKMRKETSIVSSNEVREIADKEYGIQAEELDAALDFFHDTGTIILLRNLPSLYLSEDERSKLKNLIILDPTWLIHAMRDIMELDSEMKECILGIDIRNLEVTGIASLSLLHQCWKKLCKDGSWNTEHICLVLQSYGLIVPIRHSCHSLNQEMQSGPLTPESQDLVHCSKHDEHIEFLVPCKLPQSSTDDETLEARPHECAFAFDFKHFLPVEVYHRLICLMLKRAQEKTTRKVEFVATKTTFKINNFTECDWIVEICKQKLQVKVITPDHLKAKDCIDKMHIFLKDICNETGLEGLEYYGGPVIDKCFKEQCTWSGILEYCEYPSHLPPCRSECKNCKLSYDIETVLKKSIHRCKVAAPLTESQVTGTLDLKTCLNGTYPARSKWFQIGIQLGLDTSTLKAIEHRWPKDDGGNCLSAVLDEWLKQGSGSWEALIAALRAECVGEARLADSLEESKAQCHEQSGNVTSVQKITTVNVSAETVIMPQTGSTVTVVTPQPRLAGPSSSTLMELEPNPQNVLLQPIQNLKQVFTLRTKDGHTIDIVKEVTAKQDDAWEVLAYTLGFTPATVAQVEEIVKRKSSRACSEMLRQWIEGAEGTKQPASWHILVTSLKEINMDKLASEIESAVM